MEACIGCCPHAPEPARVQLNDEPPAINQGEGPQRGTRLLSWSVAPDRARTITVLSAGTAPGSTETVRVPPTRSRCRCAGPGQGVGKIRVLMGDEVSLSTKKAILDAIRSRAELALDQGLEADKDDNPFLEGVPAVVVAIRDGRIECRVYNRDKFHAKAYITYGRLDVTGSQALVGSSNFTRPGLTENVELNIKIEIANRSTWAKLSTETSSVWTFTTRRPAEGEQRIEPLLGVDWDLGVDLGNRTPREKQRIGLTFTAPLQDLAMSV